MEEAAAENRRLTGKAVMLPKWAFGYLQSKERYETAEEIEQTVQKFRDSGFPLDGIILDWQSWEGICGDRKPLMPGGFRILPEWSGESGKRVFIS